MSTQLYLCHRCGHTVTSIPHPNTSALICPNCTSNFLRLHQNPNPTDNSIVSDQFLSDLEYSAANGVGELRLPAASSFDDFIRMLSRRIEYVMNEIDQAMAIIPHSYRNGNPPASRAVVEVLPTVKISEEMAGSGVSECSICMESFGVGDVAKELPCKHVFHGDCVLPWLGMRNSCPICRFELLTDDLEYEKRKGSSGEGSSGSRDENSGGGNRTAEGSSNEDID